VTEKTRFIVRDRVLVFDINDLPAGSDYSLYKGVIVVWDDDSDSRVLDLLDKMSDEVRSGLLAVHEHEGSVSFRWFGYIPSDYQEGKGVEPGDGDWWSIYESISLGKSGRTTVGRGAGSLPKLS
jgi:hypothetical protein